MFKAKYKVWLCLIALSFIIKGGTSFIDFLLSDAEVVEVVVQSKDNTTLAHEMSDLSNNIFTLRLVDDVTEDTKLVIIDSSEEEIEGYKKYTKALTTPIVLFGPRTILDNSSGFSKVDDDAVMKDLYSILIGIEQGRQWKELGISEEVLKGDVKLVIPSKNNSFYPKIVETMFLSLNQENKDLTLEDVEKLKGRVYYILSQCIESEDILQNIKENNDNNEIPDYLAIGPECLISRNDDLFYINSNNWMPVYLNVTSESTLDLYIKDEESKIMDNLFEIFTESKIGDYTGLRTKLRTNQLKYMHRGFYAALEVVKVGNITEEAEQEIEKMVWFNKEKEEYLNTSSVGGLKNTEEEVVNNETNFNKGSVESTAEPENLEDINKLEDELKDEADNTLGDFFFITLCIIAAIFLFGLVVIGFSIDSY